MEIEEDEHILSDDNGSQEAMLPRSDDALGSSVSSNSILEEYVLKRDYHRFVYFIPESFEESWRSFDDLFIAICQKFQILPIKLFCLLVTALTAIEIGIVTPFVLFILGQDYLATISLYLILSIALVSQIPKRFVFRRRPFVAGRAVKMTKNFTSSFPSRAVTCGMIYAAFACFAIRYFLRSNAKFTFSFWFWIWPVVLLAFLVTSYARIHLGVHYPSDCIFAAVQAVLCVAIAIALFSLQSLLCQSCFNDNCYAIDAKDAIRLTSAGLRNVNWYLLVILSVLFLLIAIACVVKPVEFYVKFHHVFGLTLPCLTFKLVTLCHSLSLNDRACLDDPHTTPNWYSYIFAAGLGILFTFVGLFAPKGNSSVVTFIVMYMATLSAMFLWRSAYL